ncbi:sulfotransferase domain-containing protein [Sediminitomix flava]|uniref:Sulfotransferase domain-containing protein n=1 Tax=Sediminitomix flava TaxID=379075 RepID=A0A315ZCJ1_SEDFL|nr:sulfotransferase domain-containing protein [Sediminitomix flava]
MDFIIIGGMKCGTTSIATLLDYHPEVCFSIPKEPDFFTYDNYKKEVSNYHQLFSNANKLWGEGSTSYTKFIDEDIPKRMYEYNPSLKLIYILRAPIKRIVSQYEYNQKLKGGEFFDINTIITEKPHYIRCSQYAKQLALYLKYFPLEQILIFTLEEYQENRENVIKKLAHFLDVEEKDFVRENIHYNNSELVNSQLNKLTGRLVNTTLSKRIIKALSPQFKSKVKNYLKYLQSSNKNVKLEKPKFNSENKKYLEELFNEEMNDFELLTGQRLYNQN